MTIKFFTGCRRGDRIKQAGYAMEQLKNLGVGISLDDFGTGTLR
ncbi:MAG: hypothetical protein WBW99_19020 [Pseudolabrys sp.]